MHIQKPQKSWGTYLKKVCKKLRKNLLPLFQKCYHESKGVSKNPRSDAALSIDLHVLPLYKKCPYKNKSHRQNLRSSSMFSRPIVFRTFSLYSTTFMSNGSFLTFLPHHTCVWVDVTVVNGFSVRYLLLIRSHTLAWFSIVDIYITTKLERVNQMSISNPVKH